MTIWTWQITRQEFNDILDFFRKDFWWSFMKIHSDNEIEEYLKDFFEIGPPLEESMFQVFFTEKFSV